jgi:5-methylcytosine-specific restriction endonuclease McrA
MLRNYRTLVLNADHIPINVRSWQNAITLLLKGKATQIDFYADDHIQDGHGRHYAIPAVISLRRYIHRNYRKAPFTKNNVLARDGYRCAYCQNRFAISQLTIDHVVPKAKGGLSTWSNCTAACKPCNRWKGDSLCSTINTFPANVLRTPSYDEIFWGMYVGGATEPQWEKWLSVFAHFSHKKEAGVLAC